MRLKISDLQRVVEETVQEKIASEAFCNEIKKAFGTTVVVSDTLESLTEQANYRLDVFERTGRLGSVKFSSKIALQVANHKDPEVRRLVVRLLPDSSKFINDKNSAVRAAAAQKAPLHLVKEVAKKYPNDDSLHNVLNSRLVTERNESALKSAAMGPKDEELLSDAWYESTARKLIQDYGRTLDTGWVPAAVNQLCSSTRAVSRYNLDAYKLMKKIVKIMTDHDDERREKLSIKESINGVESVLYEQEEKDSVEELVESNLSSKEYLKRAGMLFGIKMLSISNVMKNLNLEEGKDVQTSVPVIGSLPHLSSPRYCDEVALDLYVKHWNSMQTLQGKNYKLSWSPHHDAKSKIKFRVGLK